ncbi:MAG TPA: glycerophosphodiester phosphodiesterase family protein [Burkholderiales bacterium]|nr:glycerophosphodiester phosphodiesterase family protein [Burkholderiales bacterium]
MRNISDRLAVTAAFVMTSVFGLAAYAEDDSRFYDGRHNEYYDGRGFYGDHGQKVQDETVQLGARPFYLIEGLDDGKLKNRLKKCENGPFYRTDFSIGHRGAALQFPEHTKESYQAGARMGAGIVECDVTFTREGDLVCRHAECDLHTTTNIVTTPLNAKCSVPWTGPGSSPKCCASDLTLSEFKTLRGKMDASNPAATTPEGYLGGTASWRTDLYTGRGTLMTLKESIELNEQNGVKHTPELKEGDPQRIKAVFGSQAKYAQKMIDELKAARVNPKDVWVQSFNKDDVLYWIQNEPRFGRQAVFLDSIDPTVTPPIPRMTLDELRQLKKKGVKIIAPPLFALLAVNEDNEIVPSQYARDIKGLGFDIITWTFERSDLRGGAAFAGFYYLFDPRSNAVKKDSDMYKALDVLARQVGILGIFSDWPATVTYYANCMGLK